MPITCEHYQKIIPQTRSKFFLQSDVLVTDTEIRFASGHQLTSEWGFLLFTGILLNEKPKETACFGSLSCGVCGSKGTHTSPTTPIVPVETPCDVCGNCGNPPTTSGCDVCTGCGGTISSDCDDCDFCEKCDKPKEYLIPKCPSIDLSKIELALYQGTTVTDGCYPTATQLTRGLEVYDCSFIGYPKNIKNHPANELVLVNDPCYLSYRFDCLSRNCINQILNTL